MREQASALELSQQCRHDDREKLSRMASEVHALKESLRKKDTDLERVRQNTRSTTDKLQVELAECKAQMEVKIEENEILTSDYGTVLTDLNLARTEITRVESENENLEAEYNLLKKEFQTCQSSLLSGRTTQEVENDRIQKAVQKAITGKEHQLQRLRLEVKALRENNAKLENIRAIDENTRRELSQDKLAQKERNVEKEERLLDLATVQEALENELEIERAEKKALEEKLLYY